MKKVILATASLFLVAGIIYFNLNGSNNANNEPNPSQQASSELDKDKPKLDLVQHESFKERSPSSYSDQRTTKDNVIGKKEDSADFDKRVTEINNFIEIAGLEKQFMAMDEMVEYQANAILMENTDEEGEQDHVANAIKKHLNGKKFLDSYKEALKNNFTVEELQELKELYSDNVLMRVKESNDFADMKEAENQYSEYMKYKEENPVSEERKELIRQLEQASNLTQFSKDISMQMIDGMAGDMDEEEMDADMRKEYAQSLEESLGEQINNNLLFQNRNLSDEELKHLVETMQKPIAQKENKTRQGESKNFIKGITDAITQEVKNREKQEKQSS